jgi:radical SAM protein with 4Fe4S-binding SPASM domain
LPYPDSLHIEISTACNLACIYCPRTLDGKAEYMTTSEGRFFSTTALNQTIQGFSRRLTLHGFGEPLLHPSFCDIIALVGGSNIAVRFTTNGTLLSADISEKLVSNSIEAVTVSLDAAAPDEFSRLRGGASLDQVLNNLKQLVALKKKVESSFPRLFINMVIHKENYMQIPGVIDITSGIGADLLVLQPFVPPLGKYSELCLDHQQIMNCSELTSKYAREKGVAIFSRLGSHNRQLVARNCRRIFSETYVSVDGSVYPCCYFPHNPKQRLGHIEESGGLKAVWNSSAYKKLRKTLSSSEVLGSICKTCPEISHLPLRSQACPVESL